MDEMAVREMNASLTTINGDLTVELQEAKDKLYKIQAEMSVPEEFRRTPSSDDEASDVGGMMEDDSHGTDQSAIDADAAGPTSGPARVKARSDTRAHQLGNIVLGLKDLLVQNDIDRVTAALIIGRLALDFEHSQ